VLISGSLPSSAPWQTTPNYSSSQPAQPVPSHNDRASTAQPANPAAQSSEHTASDTAQQKDAKGAEAPHRTVRRGTNQTQESQAPANAAANGQPAAAATNNTIPLPFQAVLNDMLPQVEEQTAQFTKQAADTPLGQDLAKTQLDTPLTGKAAAQAIRGLTLDPSFQIAKQTAQTPTPGGALNQKLADGEMAFAARVVQRAGVQASVDLRDSQTVIAASRFDAPRPTANTSATVDPQAALAAKKTDAAAPQAKAPSNSAQPAAQSQQSGDASSNSNSGGQGDTSASDAAAEVRAASESQDASAAMQPVQHTMTSVGAVTAATADGGAHSPGTAKASAETGTTQLLEPQGETAAHSSQSVHNISLRLSSAEQGSVQVRLSERAGELHVSVRTPDTGLTRGLRDGLPDLMSRLQVNGYRADTWQPGGNGANTGHDSGHDAPSHGNSQQRQGGGNPQQNSQDQQQPDEHTPRWVHELESSIQRSSSPWPASPAR